MILLNVHESMAGGYDIIFDRVHVSARTSYMARRAVLSTDAETFFSAPVLSTDAAVFCFLPCSAVVLVCAHDAKIVPSGLPTIHKAVAAARPRFAPKQN